MKRQEAYRQQRSPRKNRRIDFHLIVSAVFLLAAFALFAAGTGYAGELFEKAGATSSFAIKGDGLTLAEVGRAISLNEQREEGYSLVFWTQSNDVEVGNKTHPRAEELSAIYTSGNTGLLFPESNLDALADDACLMSEGATAVLAASPGSSKEESLELNAADTAYRAIDTLPSDKAFLVLKAAHGSKATRGDEATRDGLDNETASDDFGDEVLFDRLTIRAGGDRSLPPTGNTVEQSLGIGVSFLDYQVLSFLSFVLLAAVPLLLVVLLVVVAARSAGNEGDDEKSLPASRIVRLSCISVGLIAVTLIIVGLLTEFSAYFPTRWSVPSEWESVAVSFVERAQFLFTSETAIPDEAYYALFAAVCFMAVSALIGLMVSYHFYSVSAVRARARHVERWPRGFA